MPIFLLFTVVKGIGHSDWLGQDTCSIPITTGEWATMIDSPSCYKEWDMGHFAKKKGPHRGVTCQR